MKTLSSHERIVIVGAGLAGWRLVEALRRDGYNGAISLVGDEPHPPYDRPPLSKQVLVGKWPLGHTTLADDEKLARAEVDLHLGSPALSLDPVTRDVELAGGERVGGSRVVIATGCRARRLGYSAEERVHTLRTRDDVTRLNADLARAESGATVAIIGGGFIGAETATALRARGYRPVVLEAAERPLHAALGERVSGWLEGLASHADVELRSSQHVSDVVADGDDLRVMVEGGDDVVASVVVVGAGVLPNVEWLASSGLAVDNGVLVDENLHASDTVAAIGDVARFRWRSVAGWESARIEHWQVANDHAATLARLWTTGQPSTGYFTPYFWSDQYGKKIQMLGHPRPSDDVERVAGEDGRWLALYSRDGLVTGVVTLSNPRALMLSKGLLESPTSFDEAVRAAPWSA